MFVFIEKTSVVIMHLSSLLVQKRQLSKAETISSSLSIHDQYKPFIIENFIKNSTFNEQSIKKVKYG